jgi:hypothetical protein
MNSSDELSRLFAAERTEAPTVAATSKGWKALQGALEADLPALAVAHGPLKLGLSLASKSFIGSGIVAFAVTTAGLGIQAAVTAPAANTAPSLAHSAPAKVPAAWQPIPGLVASAPEAASATASAAPVPPDPVQEPASTFAAELRLIKAAKRELDAGRGHLATIWLDQHAQLYPAGVFRTERESLRAKLALPLPRGENPPVAPRTK